MKTKMMRTMTVVAATAMMLAMVGCKTTKTETVTDADGNSTTTTTTTENGETTTTVETTEEASENSSEVTTYEATLVIENTCGVDIQEMYFSEQGNDQWGDEILGENAPLLDGEYITYEKAFTYNSDSVMWDLLAVDANGGEVSFEGMNMAAAADPENITLTLASEDDGYVVTVK